MLRLLDTIPPTVAGDRGPWPGEFALLVADPTFKGEAGNFGGAADAFPGPQPAINGEEEAIEDEAPTLAGDLGVSCAR